VTTPLASVERVHAFDNLRALAMLAGVLFHAALAYSPLMRPFWSTADSDTSLAVDLFAWFLHLFRMPLFFLVAGFFAARLIQTRGVGGMMQNRAQRVLLPLLLFWPLIYLAMDALTLHAVSTVENPSPLLVLFEQWQRSADAPSPPPSLMHLWFLYYLMIFCVLVWVAGALELGAVAAWFARARIGVIVFVLPLVLVPAAVSVYAPMPAPESFLPQWWALLYFGCYFFLGYQLHRRRSWAQEFKPLAPWLLLAGLATYACFFGLLHSGYRQSPGETMHWLVAVLQTYAAFWLTLCGVHAAESWLNSPSRPMRYIADASYWVYLVHLPILFALQYPLLDVALPWPLKFAVSVLGTCILAFGSYQFIVRRRWIGRLLNGSPRTREFPTASLPGAGIQTRG
jgi:glucans biosynthesis protein C